MRTIDQIDAAIDAATARTQRAQSCIIDAEDNGSRAAIDQAHAQLDDAAGELDRALEARRIFLAGDGNENAAAALAWIAPVRQWRAYCASTGWQGKVRSTAAEARQDAARYSANQARQGGYATASVIIPDPDCQGRCAYPDGSPVWPRHGRSTGTVRWRIDDTR